jgi:hypothetical protein
MSTQGDSQSPTARALFEQLSETASSLNSASDLLNARVEQLDSALQKFNLGVACWETFARSDEEAFPLWFREEIGYAKIKDKWRIGLRELSGHEGYSEQDKTAEWPFTEAPREMRVRASSNFAKLIAKLNEVAKVTEQKLTASTTEVERLTTAIDALFDAQATRKSKPANQAEPLSIDNLRNAVTQTLHEKGHETASALLQSGQWTVADGSITVKVSVKKTMLSLTMNPEAERIIRTALQQAGSNAKFIVLPGPGQQPLESSPAKPVSLTPSTVEGAE